MSIEVAVRATGCHALAVGAQGDGEHFALVPLLAFLLPAGISLRAADHPSNLARFGVPNADIPIVAGGGDRVAVGAERDGIDGGFIVTSVGADFSARAGVPDHDSAIETGAGQAAAVGAVGDGGNLTSLPQFQATEDPYHMLGQIRWQDREIPASLAKCLARIG